MSFQLTPALALASLLQQYNSTLPSTPMNHQAPTPSFPPARLLTVQDPMAMDRPQFYLFIKMLFRYLEKVDSRSSSPSERLLPRAKVIVATCARQNRTGHSTTPLPVMISRALKHVVGDYHWIHAKQYFAVYQVRQLQQQRQRRAIMSLSIGNWQASL